MNRKPVIGITVSMNDDRTKMWANRSYFRAVYNSGCIPVFLPYTDESAGAREFFESGTFDGYLFSGGIDVNPALYGEEILNDSVNICEHRDNFEMELARLVKDTDIPVLGICRGVQSLNVAFGGTLYQDVPNHRQEQPGRETPEPVVIEKGSFMYDIFGSEKGFVNSFHHQCVKTPAPGFKVSVVSESDGINEAIEPINPDGRFIIGVQWHPELFFGISESSDRLFAAFAAACREKM